MKFLLITILLASFIGIAVFGLFGMNTVMADMQSHENGCVLAISQGMDCPEQINPIDYIAFHFNVFRNFSAIVFSNGFFVLFLLFALFTTGAKLGVLRLRNDLVFLKLPRVYYLFGTELFKSLLRCEFIRWLALLVYSPSLII